MPGVALEGPQGIQGPTGPQGPIGPIGLQGIQGVAGTNGRDGAVGPQGPIGVTGLQGEQGIQGITGATGETGPVGPQGIAGANGADGADGAAGPQGPIGTTGLQGVQGPQGVAGNDGAAGPQGPQGDAGPLPFTYQGNFNPGVTYGTNDAVTFNGGLWKLNNFIGAAGYYPVEGQWTLIIPAGTPGENGSDGAPGETGSQGLYYLGNYVSGNGYSANIAVVKGSDNNLYIAKSNGGLSDPVGNSAEWDIFLPSGLSNLNITTNSDPIEGELTIIEAPGSITIQSNIAPGLVTIQSYLGLQVNSHPEDGGIYLNGRDPEDKVVTIGDIQSINTITIESKSSSYTLQLSDINKLIRVSDGNITIPSDVFTAGNSLTIQQTGATPVSLLGSGITIQSTIGNNPITKSQYSALQIICVSPNTFTVIGDIQ